VCVFAALALACDAVCGRREWCAARTRPLPPVAFSKHRPVRRSPSIKGALVGLALGCRLTVLAALYIATGSVWVFLKSGVDVGAMALPTAHAESAVFATAAACAISATLRGFLNVKSFHGCSVIFALIV
jgi:hypothetical protein